MTTLLAGFQYHGLQCMVHVRESRTCTKPHKTLDSLKQSLMREWRTLKATVQARFGLICLMDTFGFLWTYLRFHEVFTVRFRPLPERRPSFPGSLKRQIASETVCRGTFTKRTVVFFAETTPK
ncbi:hypothetical protein TNCV_2223191 [Trichonephila clavipes]|nr:hypothetical protein TNCV_2223191 [Trichonephila clavipes]